MKDIQLQIVEQKKDHFLNNWNKLTIYEINKILLVFFLSVFIGLPILIYLIVLICILSYVISYKIFKSFSKKGTLVISEKMLSIQINETLEVFELEEVKKIIITYKSFKKGISNKNRQIVDNWIYIKLQNKEFMLNFIFLDNKNFHNFLDEISVIYESNSLIEVHNLAKININNFM